MKTDEPPECECLGCGRKVRCIRVKDGTMYRPFAWFFPTPGVLGWCGECRERIGHRLASG